MNIADALSRQAEQRPDAVAIVEGGNELSYADLDRAVWRAAKWFLARGVGPADTVALSLGNTSLHIVAILALARMGAVQIGIAVDESAAVRDTFIDRFDVRWIVSDGLDPASVGIPVLRPSADWLTSGSENAASPTLAASAPGGDAVWALYVSSGTTGTPSATPTTHAMEIWRHDMEAAYFGFRPGERYINFVDLTFSVARYRAVFAIFDGLTIVLVRSGASGESICRAIDALGVSYLSGTPIHAHRIMPLMPNDTPRFPGVRVFRVGASAVSQQLRQQIMTRITPNLFVDCGANEAGIFAIADPDMIRRFPGTLGRAVPGIELQVVDNAGAEVPNGDIGLVRVRGPGIGRGYIGAQASGSAKGFIDGWFYPGDVATLSSDGVIYLKGRADDLMSFDGVKIAPMDIEEALLSHPAVVEAAAFPVSSTEHQDIPAAVVVVNAPVRPGDLVDYVRGTLGARAPRVVGVVDAIPKNAMGKPLKRELSRAMADSLRQRGYPKWMAIEPADGKAP